MAPLILLFLTSTLSLLPLGASQTNTTTTTDTIEVSALIAVFDSWNILGMLNRPHDPCAPTAWLNAPKENLVVNCNCSSPVDNTCHIVELKVSGLNIVGEIPNELFDLKELVQLDLSQNLLSGQVPPAIGSLSNMSFLDLSMNKLSGNVPSELGNLTKLYSLSFRSNRFNGVLPEELGNLTSLQYLYFDSSGVTGDLPHELAKLRKLKALWVFDNDITGTVPSFIGSLKDLTDLRIYGTSLKGPIPTIFSALEKLEVLILGDLIPPDSSLSFLENLTSLSILSLRNSQITGQIPDYLGEFVNLTYLDLSFNNLSGQIPRSFQNFSSLQHLYLGTNNLTGDLPTGIITPNLTALDVSFNPISGSLPYDHNKEGFSMNFIGTLIDSRRIYDSRSSDILYCLHEDTSCSGQNLTSSSSSFSVKCGGKKIFASGTEFYEDSDVLGAADFRLNTTHQWVVSNVGSHPSNPNSSHYIVTTNAEILGTSEPELYKTARVSPSSLRYYAVGLVNGKYTVNLHFAEIVISDNSSSWKGLGKRLFDIYIQGNRVLQDFNIIDEAKGSKRAMNKTFEANVTNSVMDIHFFWAGKGTCCIPYEGTYGPLVSAIHVYPDFNRTNLPSTHKEGMAGRLVGFASLCIAGAAILSSIVYLRWKWTAIGRTQTHSAPEEKS
ncbi:probable LRR receptor-like serine/threonine-protein kinase At1g56140 isoform X1 [Ananas comosus]|uniref:non-specific serine/threonine protein kinase n=1 Tax=Ananas comosus TaxID=4615 RepID=A0A6P5F8T6_ANACO|nr:probable LRR receptor-like serine/threonine-protein kinase At1g56140 isoform X1 [Ananas comosus]